MIDTQLHHESIRMVKRSNDYVNNIALTKVRNRGYINKAHVARVVKINDKANIQIRADGAIVEFSVDINEVERVYGNPLAYAEKYI